MLPLYLSGKSCQVICTIVPLPLPSLLLTDCPDFEGSAQLGKVMSYFIDYPVFFNIVQKGWVHTHVHKENT